MKDSESIRLMMQEVGLRDEEILEVLQTGDDAWAVRFAEVDVELEFDADTRKLMLSSEISKPPADKRADFYETLLLYNLLGAETGGVRMALTEAGGAVLQMVDLHCLELTTELLAIVLHNLNARTLIWRDFFAAEESDEDDEAGLSSDEGRRMMPAESPFADAVRVPPRS